MVRKFEVVEERDWIIRKLKEILPVLRGNFGVEKVGVFGSVVRGEQTEESDIDILVSFRRQKIPSLIGYMRLKNFLEDFLGKKVDLVMDDAVKPEIKAQILKEVVYV